MPYDITEILKMIKELLYNRKFIPLYKDIIEENNEIKSKYETDEEELKKYYEDTKKFETTEKPYLDLIKEREEFKKAKDILDAEKNNLKMITIKLEIEKKEIENEKIKINNMYKEIKGLDLNKVFKFEYI